MACNAFKVLNVLANDSDPDGHAISLVSVTPWGDTDGTVISSTNIQINSGPTTGSTGLTYVIQDSLGATATGQVNITVTGSYAVCNP